ncbi:hypothetical protein JMG10_19925 [Nostoc ellipsosporum NOK]|jgi:hypothetical protein|nr:hypothetical protein [Nostoc ellipsosporum NOK]
MKNKKLENLLSKLNEEQNVENSSDDFENLSESFASKIRGGTADAADTGNNASSCNESGCNNSGCGPIIPTTPDAALV